MKIYNLCLLIFGLFAVPGHVMSEVDEPIATNTLILSVAAQMQMRNISAVKVYENYLYAESDSNITPEELQKYAACQLMIKYPSGKFAKDLITALKQTRITPTSITSASVVDCHIGCEFYDNNNKLILSVYKGAGDYAFINGKVYRVNETLQGALLTDLDEFLVQSPPGQLGAVRQKSLRAHHILTKIA